MDGIFAFVAVAGAVIDTFGENLAPASFPSPALSDTGTGTDAAAVTCTSAFTDCTGAAAVTAVTAGPLATPDPAADPAADADAVLPVTEAALCA